MKKSLIIFGSIIVIGCLLWGGFYWFGSNLAGGGASEQIAPDTIQTGESTDITFVVTATGGGGKIGGRFKDISLHYKLAGETIYKNIQPQQIDLPDNFETAQSKTFQSEAYKFTIPPYPKGTTGEIEYYIEMTFDGYKSHQDGVKKIKIVNQKKQSTTTSTKVSLSADKKNIISDGKILLTIDDNIIFDFFKNKSQLCDEYNITTTSDRKMFCQNKTTFKNETRFKSIVSSPDGKKIGFTIESDTLSPDTVVGIFYPYNTTNKVNFLSNYYLGNEFLSFSPNGTNFVYSGGCFEAICAFYIKDSETLKDKIDFIPQEADVRGNYEFVRWISNNEIEYKLNNELKRSTLRKFFIKYY